MGGYPGDPGDLRTRSVKSWGLKVSRRQAAEKMLGIVPESGRERRRRSERTKKATVDSFLDS